MLKQPSEENIQGIERRHSILARQIIEDYLIFIGKMSQGSLDDPWNVFHALHKLTWEDTGSVVEPSQKVLSIIQLDMDYEQIPWSEDWGDQDSTWQFSGYTEIIHKDDRLVVEAKITSYTVYFYAKPV